MTPPLPPWLEAFRHRVEADVVETHISWILLSSEYAWKLKKPVSLPFVDYGTPARRAWCCQEELRLNRRFAPDLYLGLDPVGGSGEWAVRMRRFDEAQRLDHVCAQGQLRTEHLDALVQTITHAHGKAGIAGPTSPFGEPEQVLAPALENFVELLELQPQLGGRLTPLQAWTHDEFGRIRPLLAARKAAGRIRECHGDLHLGNLILQDDRVLPFDCIEFNPALRWIDVASELAFTWVDLLDHRQPGLAGWLLNAWREHTGDHEAIEVMRFYGVYRALVRAKVAALSDRREDVEDYLKLAERIARSGPPKLVITHGLSGSGKTLQSGRLLQEDPLGQTLRLRADVERKRLFGLAPLDASAPLLNIYTAGATRATYGLLATWAGRWLAAGWSVIVDAAFLKRRERDAFHQLALTHNAGFGILACDAPLDQLRQRLLTRRGDASEATVALLAQQCQWLEALGEDEHSLLLPQRREPT
ncbi:bifunctional aminoglycoside phosphotransferase/ATP-binding protein [Zoogloea sp.]|uniref:bifunctional aminoglycoside phosphotransferase/ATP-binding protein n=1 Tax=Zoogloea sp. TaxID=49181 RepID=UPI0026300236|nr:bifunctional aminoglycoside phosphotransferase/ATP-binding protein [Zoogloea sp.]MDD3353569.1 AAA family ATPase [Zoogloea sp.]